MSNNPDVDFTPSVEVLCVKLLLLLHQQQQQPDKQFIIMNERPRCSSLPGGAGQPSFVVISPQPAAPPQ